MNSTVTETTPPAPDVGLHANMPFAEYKRARGISKHGLDKIAINPERYMFEATHPKDPTPAMRWGRIVDMAVFEPELFAREVVCLPEDAPARPQERWVKAKSPRPEVLAAAQWWAKWDAENVGKEMISRVEQEELEGMLAALKAHPAASKLIFGGGQSQVSMFWDDPETGLRCKGRPDLIHPRRIMVDLKTAESASREAFMRAVWNFRYDVQSAYYHDGYKAITGEPPVGFVFVVVEKVAPFQVACYAASESMLEAGRRRYRRDLNTFAECVRDNIWPGYGDEVMTLDLPGWAMKELGL